MLNPQLIDQGDKVKLTWTPDLTGQGYRLYVDGAAVSRTFKPDAASTTFSKPDANPHRYGVQKMDVVDDLEEVEFPEAPPPPPPDGDDVVLVNRKWSPPNSNWGAKDLVDVRITDTSTRRDAIALAGSGSARRVYIEQHSGDGVKIGPATPGPVAFGTYAEQSVLHSVEVYGATHQDGIQAMGGKNVKFVGFYMQKDVGGNSHLFCNEGSGQQGKPTDIVVEFSVVNGYRGGGGHNGGTPVKLYDSVRCGLRHCLVVYNPAGPGPVGYSPVVSNPVMEDSYSMTHAKWDAAGQPKHQDLWNANGSHKSKLDALIANGDAERLTP